MRKTLLTLFIFLPGIILAQSSNPRLNTPRVNSIQFYDSTTGLPVSGQSGKVPVVGTDGRTTLQSIASGSGGGIQVVADTTTLKALGDTIKVVMLKSLGSAGTGGGLFSEERDSVYQEGVVAFGVTTAGKQRIRLEYLENPNTINALWAGTIQGAIDASKDGYTIQIPSGVYDFSANASYQLNIHKKNNLRIVGEKGTTLRLTASHPRRTQATGQFIAIDSVINLSIENITIDGQISQQTSGANWVVDGAKAAIFIGGGNATHQVNKNVTFRDVTIKNYWSDGFWAYYCDGITFDHCVLDTIPEAIIIGSSNNVSVINSRVGYRGAVYQYTSNESDWQDGIEPSHCTNVYLSGNQDFGTGSAPPSYTNTFFDIFYSQDVVCIGNIAMKPAPIEWTGSNRVLITGNSFTSINRPFLPSDTNITVRGNIISVMDSTINPVSGQPWYGIFAYKGSGSSITTDLHWVIEDNTIIASYGIGVLGDANGLTIRNNHIFGTKDKGYAIYLSSAYGVPNNFHIVGNEITDFSIGIWLAHSGIDSGRIEGNRFNAVTLSQRIYNPNSCPINTNGTLIAKDNDGVTSNYFQANMLAPSYSLQTLNTAPTGVSGTGTLGEIRWDAGSMYVCIGLNTWKKVSYYPWTSPKSLNNLRLWLEPSASLNIGLSPVTSHGDIIGGLGDISGSNRNPQRTNTTGNSIYHTNSVNGEPVVAMVGANNAFRLTPYGAGNSYGNSFTVTDFTFHVLVDSTADTLSILLSDSLGTKKLSLTAARKLQSEDGTNTVLSSTLTSGHNAPTVFTFSRTGSTITMYENNNLIGTGTFSGSLLVKNILSGGSSVYALRGLVAPYIVFGEAQSAHDRFIVVNYLLDRFGIVKLTEQTIVAPTVKADTLYGDGSHITNIPSGSGASDFTDLGPGTNSNALVVAGSLIPQGYSAPSSPVVMSNNWKGSSGPTAAQMDSLAIARVLRIDSLSSFGYPLYWDANFNTIKGMRFASGLSWSQGLLSLLVQTPLAINPFGVYLTGATASPGANRLYGTNPSGVYSMMSDVTINAINVLSGITTPSFTLSGITGFSILTTTDDGSIYPISISGINKVAMVSGDTVKFDSIRNANVAQTAAIGQSKIAGLTDTTALLQRNRDTLTWDATKTNLLAYQPLDADLTYLASFTPTANVKTILNAADYSAIRTAMSLVIGTNVEAWDSDLDALAALSSTAGTVRRTGAGTFSVTASDTVGLGTMEALNLKKANNLSDIASAATARTNLGATASGANIFTVPNPGVISYPRINADNSVGTVPVTGTSGAVVQSIAPSITTPSLTTPKSELRGALSDDQFSGTYIGVLLAAVDLTQWDAVYLNSSSKWAKADANGSGTYPAYGIVVASTATDDEAGVLTQGVIRNDSWTWTPGGLIYLSGTAGALTQTAPSTSGDKVQIIGWALDADRMYLSGNLTFVEVP